MLIRVDIDDSLMKTLQDLAMSAVSHSSSLELKGSGTFCIRHKTQTSTDLH